MFIAINIIVALFFAFLIIIGIRFRIHSFIAINLAGLIIAFYAIMIDVQAKDDKYIILIIMMTIISILFLDFIISFNKNTENKVVNQLQLSNGVYLSVDPIEEHFILFGSKKFLEDELDLQTNPDPKIQLQTLETWQRGNWAFIKGDYINAIRHYKISLELTPTAIANVNLSGVFLRIRKFRNALEYCERALKINANLPEAWINQGIAHANSDEMDQALSDIEHAAVLRPENDIICLQKGIFYYSFGETNEALLAFDKAIQLNTNNASTWYYKGLCLSKQGQHPEALTCFEKANQLNRRHYHAFYFRGNLLNRGENYSEAIKCYDQAIKFKPDYKEAWNNKGIALCKRGKYREALRCYEKALKINPNYHEAWINQGLAFENVQIFDRAIYSYQRFIELAPASNSNLISNARKRIQELQTRLNMPLSNDPSRPGVSMPRKNNNTNGKLKAEPTEQPKELLR